MRLRRAILTAGVCAAVLTGAAYTRHYSFSNGYPVGTGISTGSAKAVENGGASMSTATKIRPQRVVQAEKKVAGRVTKVSDGDTVWVTPTGGRGVKVRMNRIDAPEQDQPGGAEATEFLKGLVGGRQVEVRYAERDDHGRVLGTLYYTSEKGLVDVNLTMILNGWAWHYYSFATNDKLPAYDKAEQAARKAQVGLWAKPNPIRPYDWRKGKRR